MNSWYLYPKLFRLIDEKVDMLVQNYLKPLRKYEKENNQIIIPDASVDLIHRIYGILDINATDLSEESESLILYYKASLLEHNCTPNTMVIIDENDGFKVTFRAAGAIREGK